MKLCRCKKTGLQYAVKMFRSEDQEMFLAADREFKIMQRLAGHPNLVGGIDYIPEQMRGRGYLIMERVLGKNLLNHVVRGPGSTEAEAKEIMRKVLSGIEHMHERGVIHRDMNPTNVFLDEELGTVKILDFNVSKLIPLEGSDEEKARKNSRF